MNVEKTELKIPLSERKGEVWRLQGINGVCSMLSSLENLRDGTFGTDFVTVGTHDSGLGYGWLARDL